MSNVGRFVDRYPLICAAGKPCTRNTTVRQTFREYKLQDQVDAIKHEYGIFEGRKVSKPVKLQRSENIHHRGTHDKILENLRPNVKTRYQELICDLRETTYGSYWKKPLGKKQDAVAGLPKEMNEKTKTFGHEPREHISAYDVILPNVPRYKVLCDSQVNHDAYKKIYGTYNTGERIDRNYYKPPYDPNNCAGYKSKYDKRGLGSACSMQWFNPEKLTVASKNHVNYAEENHTKMGVRLPPTPANHLPEDYAYGKPTKRELHGMAELLKPECEPSIYKRETLERMASLNLLRQNIKKRFSPTFTLTDFFNRLAFYDQNSTNFITLDEFYGVISCLKLNMNRENLEVLFRDVGIIQDNLLDYRKFIDALAFDMELGKKLDPLPQEKMHYCSESSAANVDRYIIDNSYLPAAGLSSHRYDLKTPPRRGCESERNNLLTDDVEALVHRSIFMQYNISYRDMFQKRSKEFIKTLFENCGYKFEEGAFDALYQQGLEHDRNGSVCVDTFNQIVKKNSHPLKKLVDELECPPQKF